MDVEQILNRAAQEMSQQLKIPGFRPGHVPRSVIESKVGIEAIADYVFRDNQVVSELYLRALDQVEEEPVSAPQVALTAPLRPGIPFTFEATVDIKPEVVLKGHKTIKVEQEKVTVSAKEIDQEIDNLRDRFAELKTLEGKKLAEGLFAVIDFEGSVEDKPLEGGTGSDYLLEIGSGTFWEGFESQLVGAKAGEERTIEVKIPDQYFEADLAGKTATFKVTVKEIKEKVLPPADDEFAKKVGFDSMKAFKEDLKKNIQQRKESQATMNIRTAVVAKAVDQAKVDMPKSIIEDYQDRMWHDFEHGLMERGIPIDEYAKYTDQTVETLKEQIAKDAERMAKTDLVLEAVSKQEKLELTDEEVNTEMDMVLVRMGDAAVQFTEGPDALRRRALLRSSIRVEMMKAKAADFLVEHSNAAPKKEDKPAPKAEKKPAKPAAKKKEEKE